MCLWKGLTPQAGTCHLPAVYLPLATHPPTQSRGFGADRHLVLFPVLCCACCHRCPAAPGPCLHWYDLCIRSYLVAGGLMTKDADGFWAVRSDEPDPLHAVRVVTFAKVGGQARRTRAERWGSKNQGHFP